MNCIQCLKFLWCQCQCQRDGVLLYMRHRTGLGNRKDIAAANAPSQRNKLMSNLKALHDQKELIPLLTAKP
jgi:hypothetical protein